MSECPHKNTYDRFKVYRGKIVLLRICEDCKGYKPLKEWHDNNYHMFDHVVTL